MCKIGILELSWHGNLLPPMIEIAVNAGNDVTVVTTESNWDIVKASPLVDIQTIDNKLIVDQSQLHMDTINSIEEVTKNLNFLWTLTPYGPPVVAAALLNLPLHCPSATFVHEGTLYSGETSGIIASIAERIMRSQSMSDTIPNPLLHKINNRVKKERYLDKYDLLVSIFPPVENFINFAFPSVDSDCFLPRYYEADIDHIGNRLQLTVPGSVDAKIRDYDSLFNAIESVPELKEDVHIVLLGKPRESNSEIITTCKNLNSRGFHIKFFNKRVPESQYITELKESNLLISPDRVHVNRDRRHVIRGQTKSTGAIGDSIRSGTALLLPNNHCVPKKYDDLIYKYRSSNDMAKFIRMFLNSSTFRESMHKTTTKVARKFNKTRQAKRFNKVRNRTINLA